MGTDRLTDKNFYLKLYSLAAEDIDEFKSKYSHYLAENIQFNYFDGQLGEYVELKGRSQYFDFLKRSGSFYNFLLDEINISEDQNRIFISYQQITTEKSPYYEKNLPAVEGLSIQFIEDNRIVRVKNMMDTFQVLKHIGSVVMKSEDKERISQYLQNLISIGIIDSKHLN
jgi:hypothetical protein